MRSGIPPPSSLRSPVLLLCGRRQWQAGPFTCCPTIRSRRASFASVPARACDLRRCGGWRASPRRERLALAARCTPTIRRPHGHEASCSCPDRTLAPDPGRAAGAASLACSHAPEPGRATGAARPVFDSHAPRALLGQSTRTPLGSWPRRGRCLASLDLHAVTKASHAWGELEPVHRALPRMCTGMCAVYSRVSSLLLTLRRARLVQSIR